MILLWGTGGGNVDEAAKRLILARARLIQDMAINRVVSEREDAWLKLPNGPSDAPSNWDSMSKVVGLEVTDVIRGTGIK